MIKNCSKIIWWGGWICLIGGLFLNKGVEVAIEVKAAKLNGVELSIESSASETEPIQINGYQFRLVDKTEGDMVTSLWPVGEDYYQTSSFKIELGAPSNYFQQHVYYLQYRSYATALGTGLDGTTIASDWLTVDGLAWCNNGSSDLQVVGESGLCNTSPVLYLTSPVTNIYRSSMPGFDTLEITGQVTDVDPDQTIVIQWQIDSTDEGGWIDLGTVTSGTNVPIQGTAPIGLYDEGEHTINVRAYDGVNYSPMISRVFKMDLTIPVCGTTWAPAEATWKTALGTASFSLSGSNDPTENGVTSGMSATSYSCVTGNTNGDVCQVRIKDKVGHERDCGPSPENLVDLDNPVCGDWLPSSSELAWKTSNRTQAFNLVNSTDPVVTSGGGSSGMAAASYSCTAGANNGNVCSVIIKDKAGRSTSCTSPANKIDTLAPSVSATGASNSWRNTNPNLVVTAVDQAATVESGQSGVATVRYAFATTNSSNPSPTNPLAADCLSGGTEIANGTTLTDTPQGGTTLFVCTRDVAGNVGMNQGLYNWENVAPIVTVSENPPVPGTGYYDDTSPTIRITGVDNVGGTEGQSGVSGIRFQWNTAFGTSDLATGNLIWKNNNTSTTIPQSGTHMLYYQTRDNAGNVSQVESKQYILNADVPTQELIELIPGNEGTNGWVTSAPLYQVVGHYSVSGVESDAEVTGIYVEEHRGEVDPGFEFTSFDSSSYQDMTLIQPPKFVNFSTNEGISTTYYAVTTATKHSTLESTTVYLDTKRPTGYFIIASPTGEPIDNKLALHYSISDPLSGNFLDVTSETQIEQNSGLATCEIQMATANRNTDGSVGNYSPFTTILSVNNCGAKEATNSAIAFTDYTAQLAPGKAYLFHLNFVDEAGNAGQLPLLSADGKELTEEVPPIISSFPPTITLDVAQINQDYLLVPEIYQDEQGNIFAVVTA